MLLRTSWLTRLNKLMPLLIMLPNPIPPKCQMLNLRNKWSINNRIRFKLLKSLFKLLTRLLIRSRPKKLLLMISKLLKKLSIKKLRPRNKLMLKNKQRLTKLLLRKLKLRSKLPKKLLLRKLHMSMSKLRKLLKKRLLKLLLRKPLLRSNT